MIRVEVGDLQLYFHLGAYKLGPFRTFPERSVSELCELPVDWRRLVDKARPPAGGPRGRSWLRLVNGWFFMGIFRENIGFCMVNKLVDSG